MASDPQPASPESFLTESQRRLAATAVAVLAGATIVGALLGCLLLLLRVLSAFSTVIWPLAVAGILAMLLRPIVLAFEERVHLSRLKAIILLYALVILALVGALAFLVPLLVEQAFNLADDFPVLVANARAFLSEQFPGIYERIKDTLTTERLEQYSESLISGGQSLFLATGGALQEAGGWMAAAGAFGAALAIIPIYLFFFLGTDADPTDRLDRQLTFLPQRVRDDFIFLLREFVSILISFFRGQVVIGLLLGVILATGFGIAGIRFGIFLGLLIGVLNIIPYFGTIIGLGTVLPIAFFQPAGGVVLVAIALGIFIFAQLIEAYLLTPRIMGEQTGLHPLTIIIAIFFWGTALNGLLGMVLAIPLTAFFIIFWRLLRTRYLPQLSEGEADAPAPAH